MGEDPDEFYERLQVLVESLAPRDAIEVEVATRLAGVLIKLERLDRWSALTIADASRMRAMDYELGAGTAFKVRALADVALKLSLYLEGVHDAEPGMWELFSLFIRKNAPGPRAQLPGLWDDVTVPSSEKEWRTAFVSLKAHYWPNNEDAVKWAADMSLRLSRRLEEVDGMEDRLAAHRILNGPFDLQIKYESRLLNNLKTIRKEYSDLQERAVQSVAVHADSVNGKNEPKPES